MLWLYSRILKSRFCPSFFANFCIGRMNFLVNKKILEQEILKLPHVVSYTDDGEFEIWSDEKFN